MSESNPPNTPGTPTRLQSEFWQPIEDWSLLTGQNVEIYTSGIMVDRGRVDDVMMDGSILWLKHEGASNRRIIERRPGTYARLSAS